MTPEIYVSLIIEEDIVDNNVLNMLNEIGATYSWAKGQSKSKSLVTYENNGCAFKIPPTKDLSVENVVNYFWEVFKLEEISSFNKIIQEYKISPMLSVVVYVADIMPSINLDASIIRKLAQYNIGLDIDIILSE